jgi:cytochrome c-type biogenesis protein CcmH
MIRLLLSALAAILVATSAFAIDPDEQLADPAQEARAREISKSLRCPVCQSESIDESNAQIAQDLRVLVRERIVAGDTNEQAIAFIHARYGDYVLMKPPVKARTLLLWIGPLLFLALGGAAVFAIVRQASRAPDEETAEDVLPTEERA